MAVGFGVALLQLTTAAQDKPASTNAATKAPKLQLPAAVREKPGAMNAATNAPKLSPQEQLATGVTPDFIRVSVGIEHVDDIIADIDQSLAKI